MFTGAALLTFLKRYWIPIAVVAGLVFLSWSLHQKNESYIQTIETLQAAHAEEIDTIKKAKEAQDVANAESQQKLYAELSRVQSEYKIAQQAIADKKNKTKDQIWHSTGGNIDELTSLFSQKTGIPLVEYQIIYPVEDQ